MAVDLNLGLIKNEEEKRADKTSDPTKIKINCFFHWLRTEKNFLRSKILSI